MTESFDLAVIGAGLIGLSTARALLGQRPLSLVVLEAEDRPAAHQSGHNSGVLHSGLYYRPGSLKAQLCVRGREQMVRYCAERSVPFEICGKLVIATEEREVPALDELERRGIANGLLGIERLDADGIREHEPAARGIAGLRVADTGICDFGAVTRALAEDVALAGGEVRLECAAGAIQRDGQEFVIETPRGTIRSHGLVNCAGTEADRIALRAGCSPGLSIVPFRGEYKQLKPERRDLVRNLIYPVPDPQLPFLGVHFTRTTSGSVEAGPNAVLALSRRGYRRRDVSLKDTLGLIGSAGFWHMASRHWRTGVQEAARSVSRGAFTRALQKLVPEIQARDLIPGGSGVRAQALDLDGTLVDDFRFVRGPGALHVLSAPSPAATASLVIGEMVASETLAHLGI